MKKLTLVVAVVSVITLAQTSVAVARDDDRGDRGSYRGDANTEQSRQFGQRTGGGENRRDGFGREERNRQERIADRIDSRQERQKERIRNGSEDGSLTREEGRELRRDHRRIEKLEERFARDGRFDPRERNILDEAQDRASKRIYNARHNDYYRNGHHDNDHRHGWEERSHHNHGRHFGWWHHDHNQYRDHSGKHRISAPSESVRFELELDFRDLSVGTSGSQQF